MGTDGGLHKEAAQVLGPVSALQPADGPGQLGIHGGCAQGKPAVLGGLAGGGEHFLTEEAGDGSIYAPTAHQLLLKPGPIPHHQGEGGGTAGRFQPLLPELVEIALHLCGGQGVGGLEGELGRHGKKARAGSASESRV